MVPARNTRTLSVDITTITLSAALLLLCGCGSVEDTSAGSGHVLRDNQRVRAVSLKPTSPLREEDVLRPVVSLEIPDEAHINLPNKETSWQIEGCVPFVREIPTAHQTQDSSITERVIALPGKESKSIRVPGRFLGTTFNVVALRVSVFAEETIFVQFLQNGKPVIGSSAVTVRGSRDPQVLLFDLPESRLNVTPFDELLVRVDGHGGIIAFHNIDLLARPISAWLPNPDEERDLIAVGGDLRRGVGFSSYRGLKGEFEAPESGGFLSFSLGVPAKLRYPSGSQLRPSVSVELESESGGKIERRFTLRETSTKPRWQNVRIPLGNFSKERVRINYRVEATRDLEALCAVADVRVHVPSANAPSILLITSDTHRADHLGAANGGVDILTPNLDALAQRGVFFENCFTATNVTNPSHIALMTAVHPRDTAILNNYRPLVEDANTLAEQFREAGYATIAVTSANHLGHEGSGLGQGFDRMYRPSTPQVSAKQSLDVLEYYLADYANTPVFVWVHLFDAHTPYNPPKPFDKLYYPEGVDPYSVNPSGAEIPEGVNEQFFPGLQDMEFPATQYRGEITYLDDQLRRAFDIPRFKEGIIAFTADHGECIGHHGIFYDHASLYPSSIHVPLILTYPGCPEAVRVDGPVEQTNVGRTLLELAGLDASSFPGESLLSSMEDQELAAPTPRFSVSAHGFSAALNFGRWHLILHLKQHGKREGVGAPLEIGTTELYDMSVDPYCNNDVLEDNFEVAKELRAQLTNWLVNADPRGLGGQQTKDAKTISQLADLGYTMTSTSDAAQSLWDVECDTEWNRRFR
jgi:arylsulfatase A-like enzyme